MKFRIFAVLVIWLSLVIESPADPLTDFGLFVVDQEVPGAAWRVGIHGIKPTITDVVIDSPAFNLGLRRGDIILSIADKAVRNTSELRSMGKELVPVTVLRGLQRLTVPTSVEAAKQPSIASDVSSSSPLHNNSLSSSESEQQPVIYPQLTHVGSVDSVAYSPDGKYALSGSLDKTLKLWDISSGRIIRTFSGHSDPITSATFSPDGRHALSGSWDKTLKLWNIATGKNIRTFSGHALFVQSVAFSPDGRYILSAGFDEVLKLWDIARGKDIRTFSGHAHPSMSVTFSPDGRYVMSGSSDTLKLWEVATGKEIRTFSGHAHPVMSVTFSPDGRYALSGSFDKTLKLWEVTTGKEIHTFYGHTDIVSSVTFSPDGRYALSGSWDKTLKLWEISTGKNLRTLSGDTAYIGSVAFSPDGRYVLSRRGVNGMAIKLLDTATGKGVQRVSKSTGFIYSPDGRYALRASLDTTLELRDVATNRLIRTIVTGHTKYVTKKKFSPDSRYALSGSWDKTLKLWDVASGKNVHTFIGHTGIISSVSFSPDGRYVLSASYDKTLKLWDIATGKNIRTFNGHTKGVEFASFSPDGRFVLSASYDKTLKLWDIATGKNIRTFTGHTGTISSASFSPDAKRILSGGADRSLRLWDVATGLNVRTFERQTSEVSSVAFSPDGRYALSGGSDGTIHYWNVGSGHEIIRFNAFNDGEWITITREGYFDASENGAKYLNVRVGNSVYGIDQLYATLYRPDLVQAKLEGKDISQYASNININTVLNPKTLPPKVRFITRPAASDSHDITLQAEVCDDGGGVGDITLYLDNMPVVVDSIERGLRAVAKGTEGCQQFEKTITLQNGSNSISLMAYNKNNTIESTRDTIIITHREAITRKPTLHLLAIAVNNYRDGDLRLKYAIPDANALATAVQKTTGGLFEKVQVHTIFDSNATKESIAEKFTSIGATTRREDVFLLYVAGHGITNRLDGAYYFLPYDFRYTGEGAVTKSGISENDFKRYLAAIQATKSLLLIDTCNSGSFAEAVASRGMIEKTAVNKLVRAVGRATIVASSKDQVALEGYEGHGVFTWTLLEGMKGKAASSDGRITVNNLATFVEETLPKITYMKWGYEQIPQKSLMGMDFPIGMR